MDWLHFDLLVALFTWALRRGETRPGVRDDALSEDLPRVLLILLECLRLLPETRLVGRRLL